MRYSTLWHWQRFEVDHASLGQNTQAPHHLLA